MVASDVATIIVVAGIVSVGVVVVVVMPFRLAALPAQEVWHDVALVSVVCLGLDQACWVLVVG